MAQLTHLLRQSIANENPYNPDWFELALRIAIREGVPVEKVLWEGIREVLSQAAEEANRAVASPP